ncbi:unnamed protein product [Plutella xylostella]|uniref:(diamondback moth) hypothetical protein n=1 Tax=Plutella xylostella TaxID=51655 RepID=A0A8S4G3L5_PLUXY|nr:unnamed protein product [Plutella xylostella]
MSLLYDIVRNVVDCPELLGRIGYCTPRRRTRHTPLFQVPFCSTNYAANSLDPLDGGAASGLAFTSPRWETAPAAAVARLAPRAPAHPAAGFYYPELNELPTIATVQFAKSVLAFTSPRWETAPAAAVARLAPRAPAHPAAGFYYPELNELPTIATVQFAKIKEYSSKELNELARKEVMARLKRKDLRKGIPKRLLEARRLAEEENKRLMENDEQESVEEFTTKDSMEQLKDLEEDPVGTPRPNVPDNNVVVVTEAPKTTTTTTTTTTSTTTEPEFGANLRSMDDVMLAVARGRKLGLGRHLPRHFRSRLHHAVNKLTDIDCLVSPWGEWSPCSATCGFGDKQRRRRVLRPPAPRGRACPPLFEREHCGNANSCFEFDYFDW